MAEEGFVQIEFNQPSSGAETDVGIGSHSVGNLTFEVKPTNLLSIELFAYSPISEWGGRKLRIPLEDDALVTERGVEWVHPANSRILVVR